MNNDLIEGNWKQVSGEVQKQWGKLTNDQLTVVEGSRKKLSGLIQEHYGLLQEEAEKQVKIWEDIRAKNKAA